MKEKLEVINRNIKIAAEKSGRTRDDITLISVSKTYPVEDIRKAISLGCNSFGENRVQELVGKIEQLENEKIDWHLIGHLQSNKVKYIIGKTKLIHSVDNIKLLNEIQKHSQKNNLTTDILVEVNVAKEESKHGIDIDDAREFCKVISSYNNIKMQGFMTVAPFVENPEENRSIFRRLYDLSVDIQKQKFNNISTSILSMGMSNDYQIAIEEGATMVRIGTAIFGNRVYL